MYIEPIADADDYLDMIGNLSYLIDEAFRPMEIMIESGQVDEEVLFARIPAFVSLVNTVGYLRGRESIFTDFRPPHLDKHAQLIRDTENSLELRLSRMLEYLKATGHSKRLDERLSSYFLI